MQITAIIIAHNSSAVIASALSRICGHPKIVQCIVVDNASEDATIEIIRSQFPQVRILRNPLNMGFAAACNQALVQVKTELALLLHPDSVPSHDDIDVLIGGFKKSSKLAINTMQADREIAFWRVPLMRVVGFFDPAFFLHYEDDDVATRARAAGYDVMLAGEYFPAISKIVRRVQKFRAKDADPTLPLKEYWQVLFDELKERYTAAFSKAGEELDAALLRFKEDEQTMLSAHEARVKAMLVEFRKIPETNPTEQARVEEILKGYQDNWQAYVEQHAQDVAALFAQHEEKCAAITQKHEANWAALAHRQDAYLKAFAEAGRALTNAGHYIIFFAGAEVEWDVVDTVTIAIITYKRHESLPRALHALRNIAIPPATAVKLLVIDNDATQSASQVVQDAARYMPFSVEYVVEEKRGIPHARNKALEMASDSDYIAFVDDDDTVDSQWLCGLMDAARLYYADVVKGQVIYTFDEEHQYLSNLAIFGAILQLTGAMLLNASTNNVLFSTHIYKNTGLRFDPAFTKTGGSDHHFFRVAKGNGASIVFSAEGIVYSHVSAPRTCGWWIARRYIRYGAITTISGIKHRGYPYALYRAIYELLDCGKYLLSITRWAILGRQPLIHPIMITCYMTGRVMGLFYLSPREYK